MGRRKRNRYKIKGHGLTLENSFYFDWCKGKTDKEIIREILICARFFRVLESFDKGEKDFELVNVRVHEEVSE